jgi:hypothetical protein
MNQSTQEITFEWESDLDSLDKERRNTALIQLRQVAEKQFLHDPVGERPGNLHAHTFFSYSSAGYSPSHYALLAKRYGMEIAGIVDFDVLDGMDEFHDAGQRLNLRTVVCLETRTFVPEFSDRVINSPGEPGVAYHMAAGWVRLPNDIANNSFLHSLNERAARRNRTMVTRLNEYFDSLAIMYESDVLPLTPNRNATERHLVQAYARKAARVFDSSQLMEFWTSKLGPGLKAEDLPESPKLFNLIRSKTMKIGGAGYSTPRPNTFPGLANFNAFALACGAIPMVAWLDGTSAGEMAMEEWAKVAAASGASAINIIPDRNFTPGVKDQKLQNLYDVVELANKLNWPVIAGTEMNSYGQKFVDDFECAELRPLVPVFQRGARILYAHTALQRAGHFGYLGDWADRNLPDRAERNNYFETLGRLLTPSREHLLNQLNSQETAEDIMRRVKG